MRMRVSNLRIVGLTLAIFSLLHIAIAAAEHYYSSVHIAGPAWNKDALQLEGKVGYRFLARVSYQIGFSTTQSGSVDIQTPYVTDPEYELFADETPPGLSFDTQTGQLSGIPTTPGAAITSIVETDAGGRPIGITVERFGPKPRSQR